MFGIRGHVLFGVLESHTFSRKSCMLITLVEIRRVPTWNRHMVWTFFFLGRRQKVLMKNTLDFLPCNDHPLVFFDGWRNCQQFLLRTVDVSWSWWASHLVCDWHRWFMDFPHWCYRIPLDTFRQIATTWPRQQRISLVGSRTDPRNTFPECVEKGSRLGSPGGEVFVSKNKQIRASVQRKCWIVCEGKMGTKQHR